MDAKGYADALEELEKTTVLLICEYCGVETPSIGDFCICSNCESMVVTNRTLLERKDHVLLDSLDRINRSMADSKYEDAMPFYDKIILERNEPSLMYAAAIAYLKYSNYEIMQIGYAKIGFMEENTIHRDKAAKLASTAKRLLTKSISIVNMEIGKGNRPLNFVYNRFLSQIKMGNHKGAKNSIDILQKAGNDYVYNYAQMVFESSMERYDTALKIADRFTKRENFSINAFYYIGLSLFKKGKNKEAKRTLEVLNSILKNGNLEALILEINYQLNAI